MKEAIIKPLKGAAADLVIYMGPQVEVERIILKLETVNGIIESFGLLMQSFYKIRQSWNEMIPVYATRIEGSEIKSD